MHKVGMQSSPLPSRTASAGPASPSAMRAGSAVTFTVLAWASAFPLIRIALRDLAPLPLAAARFAVAGLLVLAWLAWKRPVRPSRADALRFLLCGLVGIALYNALLNAGQRTVSAGAASFIVNTVPIITTVLATVLLRERFTMWGWAGTAVSLAGIALIASGQPGAVSFGAGASLVLAAAVCQAAYFILQRPLVPRYGALPCTAYTLLAGALLLVPWLPGALHGLSAAPPAAAWSVIALGVLPAALGYAAWTYALGHFGAARAANFLYLVPPVATGLAFVMADEVPGLPTLAGGAAAIAGVVIVNTRGRA
ncbi:MAG TPA: EamA family transporter [Microvirga sp.]|nr:EamA family transporter [Microvirga sp.]